MMSSQPVDITLANAPLVVDLMDYLYPDIIYRFNQSLLSCWKEQELGNINGLKTAYFTCSFFSSHTRTFHWISVGPGLWNPASASSVEAQSRLRESLLDWNSDSSNPKFATIEYTDRKAAWVHLLNDLPSGRLYEDAKRDIEAWLAGKPLASDAIQRAILGIYSGYHNKAPVNIEGIFFRLLAKCGNHCRSHQGGLDVLLGTLENVGRPNAPAFDWFKPESPCSRCEGAPALKTWESIRDPEVSKDETPDGIDQEVRRAGTQELLEILFKHLLAETKAVGEQETFGEKLAARRNIALIPIYDVWREGRGFGGIKAIVLTFFGENEQQDFSIGSTRDRWLQLNYPRLRDHISKIANEVAVSAETLAVSRVITPPYDLLRHFLKVLTFLQDWECAFVVDTHSNLVAYTYHREAPPSGQTKWGWKCANGGELTATQPDEYISRDGDGNWFMWWTTNLWSLDLIPGLGQEELARFSRFAIRFQFPVACRIPANPDDRKFLRHFYLRQQLSLMRSLIPKVQARRAALRSAVSAIMGRNMSHNIGSHVLARYASMARMDLEKPGNDKADHRGDFLAYLQRRMDFLAEVATSDQAFWSQPLSLKDQVSRLNYSVQKRRFANDQECSIDPSCASQLSPRGQQFKQSPILLSFITGKESLLASVEYGPPVANCLPAEVAPTGCSLGPKPEQQDDYWFACPGGEVGLHALFVILENIIRNSARHGGPGDDTIRIFVSVTDEGGDADNLQLELIDPRTRLHIDGRPLRDDGTDNAAEETQAREEAEELTRGDVRSLYDAQGNRKKLRSLYRNINSILHDEPFLDASGVPNPNYWGVREMQICAHYLRGYSLADLEGHQLGKQVLEAGVHELGNGSYCLKYTLYLQRAKLLAAVVKDDGSWEHDSRALRGRGVLVLNGPNNQESSSWRRVAKAARDYGFLAVETDIDCPETDSDQALLPVRRVKLDRVVIEQVIENSGKGLGWMEPLHKKWAEQCQNRRDAWFGKPLYGVVIGRDTLTQPGTGGLLSTPPDEEDGGLFFVKGEEASDICPLPEHLEQWHSKLESKVIAAAWVDHGGVEDFHEILYARIGLAAVQPLEEKKAEHKPRVWISAEGAYTDSAHHAFLRGCPAGGGWELLAAAVPRVAVLDERVQSERMRDARSNLRLGKMWPLMGVWVPEKYPAQTSERGGSALPVCNLDAPEFSAVRAFLMAPAQRKDQYPVDFLVIHLTVLERLSTEKGLSLPKTLDALKNDGTSAERAEVIVVTGRGVPSMARRLNDDHMDTVRYLPISALLESLVLRPSKLALMRALWSAGRPDETSQPSTRST